MDASSSVSGRLPPTRSRRLRVVLTGASGQVARQLLPVFRARYDLVALDQHAGDGVTQVHLIDDTNEQLQAHFRDADATVHLAYSRPEGTGVSGAGKSYVDERLNVDMADRVYRLSLDAGVKRVVVASSNHAADWYERIIHAGRLDMLTPHDPPKSDNYYGWAKIAYEALGFTYACGAFGRSLEVVQIRIGAPREIDAGRFVDRLAAYKRDLGAYISPRDLQQLFVRSIETEALADRWGIPFQIFYGISNNTRAFWSLANARQIVGYDPDDDSERRYAADIAWLLGASPGRLGQ